MTGFLTLPNLAAWSLQVAILVVAALVTMRFVGLHAPAVRYVLLRTLLVVCIALPLLQPHRDATAGPRGSIETSLTVAGARTPAEEKPAASGILGLPAESWTTPVLLLLAAGTMARLIWMAAGVMLLRRLRRLGAPAPMTFDHEQLQDVIGARATIRYVGELGQPVTFGFRRPVVLLPSSLQQKPQAIQRAVLAHELWHVRRRDWIWTVAEEALRALFWFHPAIWVLLTRIQSAREEVVDELSILATGSRRSYVDALLAYADESPLFAATAFARRRHLVQRLVLISKEAVMSARRVVICCAVLVGVLASAGFYAIQAFPLVQGAGASDVFSGIPGPLEQRARPITPENPVPRRTFFTPPTYSADATLEGASGWVTVLLVLDEAGTVAESRATGFRVRIGNQVSITLHDASSDSFAQAMRATYRSAPGEPSVPFSTYRRFIEAVASDAVRAAASSRYAPPVEAPIAFKVDIPFGSAAAAPGRIPPPPPPAPPVHTSSWEASEGAIRVGGNIKPPVKIRSVNPAYPEDAKAAGVQGVVIIEARVEPDGTVQQARVLRSIPLLDAAALDAVKQWQFQPTWLNGVAVPLIVTVTVNFTLQ